MTSKSKKSATLSRRAFTHLAGLLPVFSFAAEASPVQAERYDKGDSGGERGGENGRWAALPGGIPAWFRQVPTDPGHECAFQDDTGRWFEIAEPEICPEHLGFVSGDATDAVRKADAACRATGAKLVGRQWYELRTSIHLTCNRAELRVRLADRFRRGAGGYGIKIGDSGLRSNVRGLESLDIFVAVDGNRARQSRPVTAVRIDDMYATQTNIMVHAVECDVATHVLGTSEKFYLRSQARNCGLNCLVENGPVDGGDVTPNVVNITLSGSLCDQWLKVRGVAGQGPGCHVTFACESTNTPGNDKYAVELLAPRGKIMLSGQIRGAAHGGIRINQKEVPNSKSYDLNVTCDNLDIGPTYKNPALKVESVSTLYGRLKAFNAFGGGAIVEEVGGTAGAHAHGHAEFTFCSDYSKGGSALEIGTVAGKRVRQGVFNLVYSAILDKSRPLIVSGVDVEEHRRVVVRVSGDGTGSPAAINDIGVDLDDLRLPVDWNGGQCQFDWIERKRPEGFKAGFSVDNDAVFSFTPDQDSGYYRLRTGGAPTPAPAPRGSGFFRCGARATCTTTPDAEAFAASAAADASAISDTPKGEAHLIARSDERQLDLVNRSGSRRSFVIALE